MDDTFVPPYLNSNSELQLGEGITPPDIALRLLEAEHLLHLHEYMEDALANASTIEEGGYALLRVIGETLRAESAQLGFYDGITRDLFWPVDVPAKSGVIRTHSSTNTDHVAWSRPADDGMRVSLDVPIGTHTQPIARMSLALRMARDPSAQLLDTLRALGLRAGNYLARGRAEEDLRRQATLIDLSPDGIFVRLLDGTITFWSQGAAALYGWSVQEAVGRTTQELLHARYPKSLYEIVQDLRESGRWTGEIIHYTKDGRELIVQSFWQAQFNEHGDVAELMESNVDITERRHLLEAEEAARIHAESIANQLRVTLTRTRELYETGHRLGLVNTPQEVLEALLSTSYLRDASQASIALFNHPWRDDDDLPELVELVAIQGSATDLAAPVHTPLPVNSEWLRRQNVRWQPCLINVETDTIIPHDTRDRLRALNTRSYAVFPLTAARQFIGIVSIHFQRHTALSNEDLRHVQGLVDQVAATIHNLRALAQESAARREAERANELRLRFLGMISHELRTPLTAIKGFTTTLAAKDVEWSEPEWREFISIIDHEADKLTDMIEQLLDLSRIESGTLRVDPQPQAVTAIVETVRPQLMAIIGEHHLLVNVPPGLPPVLADGLRIGQVLVNLVSNAAKYSPAGRSITITAAQDSPEHLRISVRDEGPGISPEDKPFVFEAFRRGSDGKVRQTKGAGLGLAICKGIVEAHGGRIWIEDAANTGTVVSFTLPVA